ncbi:HNH endonuclease [Arenimonas donghaensis]|uniref:HNH endonuclease n=1 Tax=Arenimonas donghaensis TaxID=375061 RepID=UPI003CCDA555
MSQAGQGRHKCAICAYSRGFRDYVEEQALYKEDLITYSNDRDSVERPPRDLIEIKRFGHHRRLERDPSIVRQIKKSLGDSCECCGIRMEDRYGEIGSGYIEAHHLIPLSKLAEGESRPVAAGDFAALCPNCHRMIHRLEDVSNIEQLRQLLRE